MKHHIKTFFIGYFVLISCNQKQVQLQPQISPKLIPLSIIADAGDADFSNFVSIGDDSMAGMQGAALYNEGIKFSYPKILSQYFALLGGYIFNQMNPNTDVGISNIYTANTDGADGYLRLVSKNNVVSIAPISNGEPLTPFTEDLSKVNNLGIPYLRAIDLKRKKNDFENPYLSRVLTHTNVTYLDILRKKKGTFYLIWLGISDLSGWALSGGQGIQASLIQNQRIRKESYIHPSTLVDVQDFKESLSELLTEVFDSNQKGIILNCPNIASVPYFSNIPFNAINLDAQKQATQIQDLSIGFGDYNNLLALIDELKDKLPVGNTIRDIDKRKISFTAGKNPILIRDPSLKSLTSIIDSVLNALPENDARKAFMTTIKSKISHLDQVRHARSDDLILLPAGKILNTIYNNNPAFIIGISYPLHDSYVLSNEEQSVLSTHVKQYNLAIGETITDLGLDARVGILDTYKIFNFYELTKKNLISFDPFNGFFSADGTHLNPRGNAILADSTLNLISKKFNSRFPKIDVSSYPGTPFPVNIK